MMPLLTSSAYSDSKLRSACTHQQLHVSPATCARLEEEEEEEEEAEAEEGYEQAFASQ